MKWTEAELLEFQAIVLTDTGKHISLEEAQKQASVLYELSKIIIKHEYTPCNTSSF